MLTLSWRASRDPISPRGWPHKEVGEREPCCRVFKAGAMVTPRLPWWGSRFPFFPFLSEDVATVASGKFICWPEGPPWLEADAVTKIQTSWALAHSSGGACVPAQLPDASVGRHLPRDS